MKLRTVVLAAVVAGTVYVLRKHQAESTASDAVSSRSHSKPATSRGATRNTRTAVRQLEEKSRYAPFPVNILLTVAAKLVGRRMDSK